MTTTLAPLATTEVRLLSRDWGTMLFAFVMPPLMLMVLGGVFGDQPDEGFGGVLPSDYYVAAYIGIPMAALALIGLPVMLALALVIAFVIHDGVRSRRLSAVYRSLVFLPFVLSIVVVGRILSIFLRSDGPLNGFANTLGWGLDTAWLGNSDWALPSVGGVIVWREFGLGVVLFLARLASAPEELFEAAKVEGASWWQTLRHVAIPQLYSTIAFWTLLNVIVMFSWVFNYVYVLTKGGPGSATTVMELEIYEWATTRDQPNIAAAMATMLLVLVALFIVGQSVLRKRLLRETA